jgi:hypothetical protein
VITITHTHADGTLIGGSRKGDGVYEILKGLYGNWRYFRSLGQLGIGQSRDKPADAYKIRRAAEALREAGHEVAVEIDESGRRDFAAVEAGRIARAGDRAERYADRSKAATANGERMREQTGEVYGALNGTPVLIGHHSERRHRNLLDKLHAKEGRAFDEIRRGEYWANRARSAEGYQDGRENLGTTLRRIETLEAEERLIRRRLDGTDQFMNYGEPATGEYGDRLTGRQADIAEELAYWRAHVAARKADGVKVWSREDFTKGDFVQFLGKWYEVLRVNGKSVTIPAMINDGYVVTKANGRLDWTDTVPYHKVTGRKSNGEIVALLAAACEPVQS